MTPQEFIDLAKTCKDRAELLQKLGNYEDIDGNRKKYIQPLREAAGLTTDELTELFIKMPKPIPPKPTPTIKKLQVIYRSE